MKRNRKLKPPSNVLVTVTEQEKAYFAGYTDAEGCISIYCNKSGYRQMSPQWCAYVNFSQTCPMVVKKMHALYGGSLYVRCFVLRSFARTWRAPPTPSGRSIH